MNLIKITLSLLATMTCACFSKADDPLSVGNPAPRLSATNQDGEVVDLGALYDQGMVLVFFYPKAFTPGCTNQACSLRDAYEELQESGVTVVGVSGDSVETQKRFAEKHQLPYILIADTDGAVMKAFRVPNTAGIAKRQAFLIKDGKIVWLDFKASTSQQAEDVKAVLKSLN